MRIINTYLKEGKLPVFDSKKVISEGGFWDELSSAPGVIGILAFYAATLTSLIGVGIFKLYYLFFSKYARQCKGTGWLGMDLINRRICIYKAKILACNDIMKTLLTKRSECSKQPDPQKCQIKVNNTIVLLNNKIKRYKYRIDMLSKQTLYHRRTPSEPI